MTDAIAGLIGAVIGGTAAVGGAWVQARTAERTARERLRADQERTREERSQEAADQRQALARQYLFALQDATESLRQRLLNWADRGGQAVADSQDPGYWDITTLYAVARALAAERILAVEGAYPALEAHFPDLVEFYETGGVDAALSAALGSRLFRYHRLALAEAALERSPEGFRILIYSEFRRRYEDPTWGLERLLKPATDALAALTPSQMKQLEVQLDGLAQRLEGVTRVPRMAETRGVGR